MDDYQANYLSQRLAQTRRIQDLAASIRFDLARSGLDDDQLERLTDSLAGPQEATKGWGWATVLDDLMSRAPERIPVTDMKTFQTNLINLGYVSPSSVATGAWDPSWYGAARRLDRDMQESQMAGKTLLASPLRAGFELLGQTLPSNIYQNIVGWAKGFVEQTPETLSRVGALGGAAGGAAIGGIVGGPVGALVGGGIGAALGFFGDIISDDDQEQDQSFWGTIGDALTPFEEYADDPKAFFEDLGYVGTVASVIGGAKLAVSGVQAVGGSTINALNTATAADVQLGLPGTVTRWAAGKIAPDSLEAVSRALARVSPVAHLTKYRAGAAVNGMFTGFSAASVGIHLTAGIGQGAREVNADIREQAAALVRAASLQGRPLSEEEMDLIDRANRGVGVGTIEQAISEITPPGNVGSLNMGPQIAGMPLSDWLLPANLMDIASFVLWPQQLLPLKKGAIGTTIAKANAVELGAPSTMVQSWVRLSESEQQLRPWVQYFMRDGIKASEARAFAKEYVTPVYDAWYRLDSGAKETVARRLADQRYVAAQVFPHYKQERFKLIAQMRAEAEEFGGKSPTAIGVYGESVARGETFLAHLIETQPPGKTARQAFLDHKAAMEEVNRYNAVLVKEGGLQPAFMAGETGPATHLQVARLPEGVLTVPFQKVSYVPDAVALERQATRLEAEARQLLDTAPSGSVRSLAERNTKIAELQRQATEIRNQLEATPKEAAFRAPDQYVLNLNRLDTNTRRDWTRMKDEYERLATKLATLRKQLKDATGEIETAAGGTPAFMDTQQQLVDLLDGWLAKGYIYKDLRDAAIAAPKTHKSLSRFLSAQAKEAAVDADVPAALRQRLEALGYKPVITGENVFMPGQAEKWAEATGIGDYTRRQSFFDMIGVRADVVQNNDLWKVRRATERAELQHVVDKLGIKRTANDVYNLIYNHLEDINHEGAVWGPFNFSGTKAHAKPRLYLMDTRQLKPQDIMDALADELPVGREWESAMDIVGALKRGAAYGGEWQGLHKMTTVRTLGRSLGLAGLPGFSDLIRTWRFEDPLAWGSKGITANKLSKAKFSAKGAAVGAVAGAVSGDEGLEDVLAGAAVGAGLGLVTRGFAGRAYGYLPDYLVQLNSALRYTLSLTFDAGRISEQNLIAMSKYHLPPMFNPKRKLAEMGELKAYTRNGTLSGTETWSEAIKLWDDVNGTKWFQNLDDTDRRMYQAGLLGFQPRNWEAAQAFMLYQRGWGREKIREAVSSIGRYGLGRSAAEKSMNFIFFPFSFSKKLLTTLGDFAIQAPARNLMVYEGMRRWYESTLDDDFHSLVENHLPLLEQLARINNLSYGISPGRWFLQGLGDQRTNWGKASFILSQFFAPSGAATPLASAAGTYGDLAINAFVPIVVTGEAIDRLGGAEGLDDILSRYVPFTREVQQYMKSLNEQKTVITQGRTPWGQVQGYLDERRAFIDNLQPLALGMGYQTAEGFLQSAAGAPYKAQYDQLNLELDQRYPSARDTLETFSTGADHSATILYELANRPDPSAAEEAILNLAKVIEGYEQLSRLGLQSPAFADKIGVQAVRAEALLHIEDRRFRELYALLFQRDFGPIEVAA